MIKEGGRFTVEKGKNQKLDKVSDEIINILKDNDIHVAFLHRALLLCDEEKRETSALIADDDDRLIRDW